MRLIDADKLEKQLDNDKWMDNYDRDFIVGVALDEAPTVDAVPVVHGEWIREDETQALLNVIWHCSKCEIPLEMNGIYTPIGAGYKYCPNCGRPLKGE